MMKIEKEFSSVKSARKFARLVRGEIKRGEPGKARFLVKYIPNANVVWNQEPSERHNLEK